jgi:hypothetical protein
MPISPDRSRKPHSEAKNPIGPLPITRRMLPIALWTGHRGLGEDDDRRGIAGDRITADHKTGLPKPKSGLWEVVIGMIGGFPRQLERL